MKKSLLSLVLLLPAALCHAQLSNFTTAAQVSIMETGVGTWTPAATEYYWLTAREGYTTTAFVTNKGASRLLPEHSLANSQIEMSARIDSVMKERAKIEAFNIADRLPTADLAWEVEKDRISKALGVFHDNIGCIFTYGGTVQDKKEWDEQYDMMTFAVREIQDATLQNSKRQEQYQEIYKDIVRRNEALVSHLGSLQALSFAKSLLSPSAPTVKADKAAIVRRALADWGAASHLTVK